MSKFHHTTILPVDACEQDNDYECGPAALRTILCSLGYNLSQAEASALSPADPQLGASPAILKAGLDKLGIKYTESHLNTQQTLEAAIDDMQLCLVCYQAWGTAKEVSKRESGHYSVVFGYTPTHFLLADPSIHPTAKNPKLHGIRSIRKDLFLSRWMDMDGSNNLYDQWFLGVSLSQKQ